eukprot:5289859-Pyramimonas_sp.AAC.1
MSRANRATGGGTLLLHFTGPPVPITARVHSTPQRNIPRERVYFHAVGQSGDGSRYVFNCGVNGSCKGR